MILFSAQDQSDRGVLVRQHPVLTGIIQVQVHLSRIRVRELPELEVDDDEASKSSMKKQQVNPIPLGPHAQSALSPDEGKIASELEKEGLEFTKQGPLKFALGVFVPQPEELQYVRILDLFVRCQIIAYMGLIAFRQECNLISRKRRSLVKLGLNLAIKLADRPATMQGFAFVERAGMRASDC